MIAFILAFVTKWKWILIGVGALLIFSAGFYTRSVLYRAGEASRLEQALKDQREADKTQFDHDLAAAKAQALIDKMNFNLNTKLEDEISARPTNCIIPVAKLHILNQAIARK